MSDNNSNNNQTQTQEVEVLKKKIALLIKGLKEEKQITTKLKEENELLKYDLEEKKLLLKKTKEEYQELVQSKISPDKLSSYFDLLENQENIETPDKEKFKLKKDNEEFHKKIDLLEEEKKNLLSKIEQLEKGKESEMNSLKNEILSLQNQLKSYKDSMLESREKSSKLIDNIKYEKLVNNDREAKIAKLQTENESLTSNNNLLKQQNGYFMQIIEQLKNQIESKGKEFYYLEKEIDDNKIIKQDEYIFKGYINKMSKWLMTDWNKIKRTINIFFGRKIYNVSFDVNGHSFDVDIDDVLKMDYYHDNKKRIKFVVDGEGKEQFQRSLNMNNKKTKNNDDEDNTDAIFVCSFTEKECKYILEFYKDMKNKYNQERGGFINSSINIGFLD
jgi:chromosome segregation ATPase